MANNEKKSLGYLGEDFQYKLVHAFMEEKEFFKQTGGLPVKKKQNAEQGDQHGTIGQFLCF